ncbi:50S ribosomal protein L6 [Desulfurispirillum indicum]|uniref:Large ribosomal subunit protein uL6 n=1 Tax=Desulfurispirillum indicum (strain ATCC BAA-1389 / DSM 22839 / S5) TaxID=653733 RepID=E6W725_DESIS|nr:50S ribosomal protein L6 [Desulfurispirillum indicum]ADU65103.1 ribosomal protein L6 [Desulfurispirillum indicum S5]UCZ57007.1 50S ribosomal protein L6 [Desulfurispirillum indicum]
MSRIGNKPIEVPANVTLTIEESVVKAKGPQGELTCKVHPNMKLEMEGNVVRVVRPDDSKENRSLHGLTRTLVNNMVVGVGTGFKKSLELVGVGYRAALKGNNLELSLGFSHPVVYPTPSGLKIEVEGQNKIHILGADKQLVGQAAAEIRFFRKPEPYKGKGVRYAGERIRMKAGKSGKKK